MKFMPYLLKTLWRHRTRTMLTVSGSAAAMLVFCFVGSVQEAMTGLTTQNESTLVMFQANKFCPATSHLPQDYDQIVRKMPGVRDVVPIQVFTNNCRASLNVVVFYGLPPESIRRVRDFKLVSGRWSEFENNQDAAVVGKNVGRSVDRPDLKPGDKLSIGDVTVTVAAIYTSDSRAEENYVYTHLDFLQRTRGLNLVGTVTQHEVYLDDSVDPTAFAERIDGRFRRGPVETDTRPKGVFQASSLADLVELIGLMHYLGYACIGLMAVLLSTTTYMAVQDRIKEHAVLQTLGFSGRRVFVLVVLESTIMSLLGGVIGVALSTIALATSGLSIGAEAVSIAFEPSATLASGGIAVSLIIGVLAGCLPALTVARMDIVDSLRAA